MRKNAEVRVNRISVVDFIHMLQLDLTDIQRSVLERLMGDSQALTIYF